MNKRKYFISLLLAFLLMLLPLSAFAADYPTGKAKSTTNIRVAPSSGSRKVNSLKSAEGVTITKLIKKGATESGVKADSDWYKVKSSDGKKIGYVIASNIMVVSGDPTKINSYDVANDSSTTDEDVPDESLPEEILSDDETVEILGDDEIIIGGSTGSITEDGLLEEAVPDEDVPDEDVPDEDVPDESMIEEDVPDESGDAGDSSSNSEFSISNKVMYATQNVNVRSKPTTSSSVSSKLVGGNQMLAVEFIPSGSNYNGTKVSGDWYRSSKGNFVSAKYLTTKKPTATPKPATSSSSGSTTTTKPTTPTTTGSTTASGAYVTTKSTITYSKPMSLASKKATLSSGAKVTVTKTFKPGDTYMGTKVSGTWYQLSDGSFAPSSSFKKG